MRGAKPEDGGGGQHAANGTGEDDWHGDAAHALRMGRRNLLPVWAHSGDGPVGELGWKSGVKVWI